MYGYAGKLLFVNLTDRTYTIEDLKEEDAKNFIGGPALGAKVLFDRMPAKTPAFAAESMIGFVSGPTNGNAAFLGGRYTVVSKSPVTDGWNDANSGGNFGVQLKKSGFDAVFVNGIADAPVYIYINSGKVEIRDASMAWGKTVIAAENALHADCGDPKAGIALIGPAGENKSYMAAVMNDSHRAAGRGGSGAVMGSKNLKAVVVSGNLPFGPADKAAIIAANKESAEWHNNGPVAPFGAAMKQYGTSHMYDGSMLSGDGSVQNWHGVGVDLDPASIQALIGETMDKKWRQKKYACNACPIGCGTIYKIMEGKYQMEETSRPEYETLGMFGAMMLNDDALVVNQCNFLCNEYGFDTIAAGGTIAWLMDAYCNGEFTIDEIDGIDLKWGNGAAILEMMEKLCANEGIGAKLLNGSREAARHFNRGFDLLAEANGIELPQHDSRWSTGLCRTFKYDPTPGRHVKGGLGVVYGNNPPEVKYNYTNTGDRDVAGVVMQEIINAAGFCSFSDFALAPGSHIKYVTAITGFNYTEEEAKTLGIRMFAIRHAFNLREGYLRKDASLSPRMEGKPPMEKGPNAGVTVDTELMADNFYKELGWDVETGMIPKDVLENYGGLESVIAALYPNA